MDHPNLLSFSEEPPLAGNVDLSSPPPFPARPPLEFTPLEENGPVKTSLEEQSDVKDFLVEQELNPSNSTPSDTIPTDSSAANVSGPVVEISANPEVPVSPPITDLPPLDFDAFLNELRLPSAFMLTRYLKSFLREFNKKSWTCDQQQKIVADFLKFINDKMRQTEPWSQRGDYALDVGKEGMEKLVMTKLYKWAFQPPKSLDVASDKELDLKMKYFHWVQPSHLDIPLVYRATLDEGIRHAQQGLF